MNAIEILLQHALATLPDSLTSRKHLLRAALHVMCSNHPDHRRVMLMLSYLDKHEAQQAKLPLHQDKPGLDGDGQFNGAKK